MLMDILIVLAVALEAYLLGSIDTGILVSKLVYHDDVRKHGSGAAGMTNMLRTFGKRAAAMTAAGDVLKGVLAVCIGRWLFTFLSGELFSQYVGVYLAAILAVVGHLKPIYFGFKGGKGVLVAGGAILAVQPVLFPCLFVIFLICLAESRLRTAWDDMPAHHWHPYYELFYVETGACSYMVENDIYDLHMGDFLLIPPHTFHYTRYRFGPCRRAAVFFRAEDVGPGGAAGPAGAGGVTGPGADHAGARGPAGQSRSSAGADGPGERPGRPLHRAHAGGHAAGAAAGLLPGVRHPAGRARSRSTPPTGEIGPGGTVHHRALRRAHHGGGTSPRRRGFSPNYLSRKFREAAGFGVHEYLTFIRLRNAAHELTATGDSITDIALRSGFSNSNYFKDAFKKQYGCTPRDYRRKTR